MLHVIHKMPYKKDFIGQTPYYVNQDMDRFFQLKHCHKITKAMDRINIKYEIKQLPLGCKIKYQDNYDAWLSRLTSK